MSSLELSPENNTEKAKEEQVKKLTEEELDEKYLITSPENKKLDTPKINLEGMPKVEYYWHASTTGVDGEILESMLASGIQPKEKLSSELKNIGNSNTPDESSVFITTSGAYAADYLKRAMDYSNEGLPTFFAIKVEERDTEYKYDTDLMAGEFNESEESKKEFMMFWFSLVLSHETVDDFLNEKMTHIYATTLQKELASLKGLKTSEIRDVIWEKMKAIPNLGVMSNSQLARFLKNVDVKKWDKTLMIFNKINPSKTSLTKNLAKKNGFDSDELKRVYVVTPNGDKDWRKWAKLIPKESLNKWENWSDLKDKEGNPIPGNGKMIRIK